MINASFNETVFIIKGIFRAFEDCFVNVSYYKDNALVFNIYVESVGEVERQVNRKAEYLEREYDKLWIEIKQPVHENPYEGMGKYKGD